MMGLSPARAREGMRTAISREGRTARDTRGLSTILFKRDMITLLVFA
jgi:hypothetical protein